MDSAVSEVTITGADDRELDLGGSRGGIPPVPVTSLGYSEEGPDLQAQRGRVLRMAKIVEDRLDLGWLDVRHFFSEAEPKDAMAETASQWKYRYAEVTWYLYAVLRASDRSLFATVVHEYVHVLIAPIEHFLPPKASDLDEFAVESVTRALMSAMGF
jgi:hypothetical protein